LKKVQSVEYKVKDKAAKLTELEAITRREVELYAGNTHDAKQYAILDDQSQTYAVVVVPDKQSERPAWVALMARIVGDMVIIDEDTSLDKPLVDALMVNGGVPREKIVLRTGASAAVGLVYSLILIAP
jgi:hypothetical protein